MKYILALASLFVVAIGVSAAPQDEPCLPSGSICVLDPSTPGDVTADVEFCSDCCDGWSPQIIGNTGVRYFAENASDSDSQAYLSRSAFEFISLNQRGIV